MLAGLVSVGVCFLDTEIFCVLLREGCYDCRCRGGRGNWTVDPGFVGTKNVVADSRAYTVGSAVKGRHPSAPHPRLECTYAEHDLRYVFSSVIYSIFGGPCRGEIVHSGMLEMMFSMVVPYYFVMRCGAG